jgi:hypothetical protein
MRRPLAACRSGFTVAAALVLLTACGGSGDDDTASSSTSRSSAAATSSASASPEAADPAFCASAGRLLSGLTPALTGATDPATLAPTLTQAATDARQVVPPQSIAADWTALTDGLDQFAKAAAAVNVDDTASAAQFEQVKNQLVTGLAGAAVRVQTYLSQQCGLQAPTGTAAPTS